MAPASWPASRRSGRRRRTPDPAHQLGLLATWQELPADHAAPAAGARCAVGGQRRGRCADLGRDHRPRHRRTGAQAQHRAAGPSGLYHLTASGETSWYGFACSIAERLRQEGRLRAEIPDPVQGLPDRGAATAEFAAQLRTAAAGLGRPAAGLGNRPARVLHPGPRPRSRRRAPADRRRALSRLRLQPDPSGCHEPRR